MCYSLPRQIDRRAEADMLMRHRLAIGSRAWKKLIHYLIEMKCLFGPFGDHLCNPERVCSQNYSLLYYSKILYELSNIMMLLLPFIILFKLSLRRLVIVKLRILMSESFRYSGS